MINIDSTEGLIFQDWVFFVPLDEWVRKLLKPLGPFF